MTMPTAVRRSLSHVGGLIAGLTVVLLLIILSGFSPTQGASASAEEVVSQQLKD